MVPGQNGKSRSILHMRCDYSAHASVTAAFHLQSPETSIGMISLAARSRYSVGMSLACLFRLHRPMLTSIVKREGGYKALCDHCGMPIERPEVGRWAIVEPMISGRDKAA